MKSITPLKLALWLLALFAIPALAWSAALDELSKNYVQEAVTNAGVVYATARGINALVSLLQGTEVDIVVVTMSIGEILDPVNDLIERFSAIILIAISSLALQKLLLVVVSHSIFNTTLTVIAALTAVAMLFRQQLLYLPLLKIFIIGSFCGSVDLINSL